MVGVAIRFDLGRYHANPWSTHVNEGATEWPPSPWRLIRALYSIARTNLGLTHQQDALDSALRRLIESGPPLYELPASRPAHTRHYVPLRTHSAHRPSTSKIIDAFRAIPPTEELKVWWHAELRATEGDALKNAAQALGYIGRSESICSARMIAGAGPESPSAWPARETEHEDVVPLLCPSTDAELSQIVASVTELRRQRRSLPQGAELTAFAVREPEEPGATAVVDRVTKRPTIAVVRVRGAGRAGFVDAVAVAQALRAAALSHYGRQRDGAASPTLSGRAGASKRSDHHRHAHYLVLPDASGRRVDRLVVWCPEGLASAEVSALAAIERLSIRGLGDSMRVALVALGEEATMRLPGVLGPARRWESLTPFALTRHPKRRGGRLVDGPEDQVRSELERRGLQGPVEITLARGSWHRFRTQKAGQSRLDRASVFGVRLEFSREVAGPLSLGALCHCGLGLFVPQQ